METPESGNELYRSSLSEIKHGQLFEWARQRYIHLKESNQPTDRQLPDSVGHIADTLNRHLKENFALLHDRDSASLDIHFPDVVAVTKDAYRTGSVDRLGPLSQLVSIEPVPFGPVEDIVGEHTIAGSLVKFHVGEINKDLRMYIQDGETIDTMGGIFRPMISVGVEGSDIKFVEQTASERIEELGISIKSKLAKINDDKINGHFLVFMYAANEQHVSNLRRLQESAKSLLVMSGRINVNEYQHLIDDLCEYLSIKLNLQMSHEIESNGHRIIMPRTIAPKGSKQRDYKIVSRYEEFIGVKPQVELIGIESNRTVALTFQDHDRSIVVPFTNVTKLHRMNP